MTQKTSEQTPSPEAGPGPVEIVPSLGPVEAKEERDRLLAALEAARKAGCALSIELGEGAVWPSALQLLAAARASADSAAGPTLAFGPRAEAALADSR